MNRLRWLLLTLTLIMPMSAIAGPAVYTVSGGDQPLSRNQGLTDFQIVDAGGPGNYKVTCVYVLNGCDAYPGVAGNTLSFGASPFAYAALAFTLPGTGSWTTRQGSALMSYDYTVAGGPTSGTLQVHLNAAYAGYQNGDEGAIAQIYLDGVLEAVCVSGGSGVSSMGAGGANVGAVSCPAGTSTSIVATIPVNYLASGTVALYVAGLTATDSALWSVASAYADPLLVADNGATITLSEGVANSVDEVLPEPGMVPVFGLGLAALAAFRRRHNSLPPAVSGQC